MFINLNKILCFYEIRQDYSNAKPYSLNITVAITGWLMKTG